LSNAVHGAAKLAKTQWPHDPRRPLIVTYQYKPRPTTPLHPETGAGDPAITYSYAAQVADVEVDSETGLITVLRLISAHDVGRAVHPQQLVGQIEGGAAQGLGWALLENLVVRDGQILTPNFTLYLIPTVYDVPETMEALVLEDPDPQSPHGARGIGEIGLIPVAPAVAAAVHDAIGLWFNELPLTPERVWRGLGLVVGHGDLW
jgi:CO/xanthine dehydrogenase Mo-binding subunit